MGAKILEDTKKNGSLNLNSVGEFKAAHPTLLSWGFCLPGVGVVAAQML